MMPVGSPGDQNGAKREPNEPKWKPKWSQMKPKGSQGVPKGGQSEANGRPKCVKKPMLEKGREKGAKMSSPSYAFWRRFGIIFTKNQ